MFTERPPFDFAGLNSACTLLESHLINANNNIKTKFQIVVDSDLDGVCSAAIVYKFIKRFYPQIEIIYSMHNGKQHGLSYDIEIDDDTSLVIIPDAGVNDTKECEKLFNKHIDVICLDHHIIERENPYTSIVSCMDGKYPNQNLCGAAVTWLFLYGFCYNCISFFDEHHSYLLDMLDLVGVATIADIMEVTNEDNMYFIQNGLKNIRSDALRAFLLANEVNLSDVSIEDIKFKVSPLISAMMRMGNMDEKKLMFRAFIDDYEVFDYEKRGSFEVMQESIYDRVVRLCKNAKGRQDRAKQKLLDECQVHEYPHIVIVEYEAEKSSTLTGLVANELTNKYCKPCIVYRTNGEKKIGDDIWYSGSARNYDGSPIESFKDVMSAVYKQDAMVQGHAQAFGVQLLAADANVYADLFEDYIRNNTAFADANQTCAIGEKVYNLDFSVSADEVDAGLIQKLHLFEHYTGYGFAQVTALVTDIHVNAENFTTMGKNSFNWRITNEDTGVTFVKFKVDKFNDKVCKLIDDIDIGATSYEEYSIDAICTFGLNIYKGEIHPQCVIKDYVCHKLEKSIDEDWDLDLDLG